METTQTKDKEEVAAEEKAAEEAAKEKAAEDEQDAEVEKLGAEFDKKADEEEHSAYVEKPEDADKDKEKDADAKASDKEEAPDDEVDESLLERAEKAGISRDKAGEFSSKEDLERTVELLEESQVEKSKTPEELEAEKKSKEEAEAKAKDDEEPYECELDPADYDEGLIKAVNELGTMLKKRVVALEKGHTKHAESLVSNRVDKHTEWLDSRINRLDDEELVKIYGEGDIDDLEVGSDQFKARAALDAKITKITSGLRKAKKTVPSRNKLFNMALESLHKGKKTTKADTKTKAKLKSRAKEALGPGSSKVSAETAEAEALQTQKDFDKKIDDED
jgi:hypothetical protein